MSKQGLDNSINDCKNVVAVSQEHIGGRVKLPPLSDRMNQIVSLVDKCAVVADIGSDHGYIPIYLYLCGTAEKCICLDVNKGPVESARKNIVLYNATCGVTARLSDGFSMLGMDEADTVLITGMGGMLIERILSGGKNHLQKLTELIVSPQSEEWRVRQFLSDNGFVIADERFVKEETKHYPVIKAVHADNTIQLSEAELRYGPVLLREKNALLFEYLQKERRRLSEISSHLASPERGENPDGAGGVPTAIMTRKKEIEKELLIIDKALSNYKGD